MGVFINHTISFLTSPLAVAFAVLAVGLLLGCKWRRMGVCVIVAGLVWLYAMSTGVMYRVLGLGLECEFPPTRVETLPQADAIVVLGGGVGGNTNTICYTELYGAADRIAHAARVWKAGKAPVVIPSGVNELQAARPLLKEFGVPESAILVENHSRNTEENARFVADYVKARHIAPPLQGYPSQPTTEDRRQRTAESRDDSRPRTLPRILLVTSAWHMRRSLLMFRKYAPGVEVVPTACDYEATIWSDRFEVKDLLPDAESLMRNSAMLKEYIGYWGYRLLR